MRLYITVDSRGGSEWPASVGNDGVAEATCGEQGNWSPSTEMPPRRNFSTVAVVVTCVDEVERRYLGINAGRRRHHHHRRCRRRHRLRVTMDRRPLLYCTRCSLVHVHYASTDI